jgi:hypothetical protein
MYNHSANEPKRAAPKIQSDRSGWKGGRATPRRVGLGSGGNGVERSFDQFANRPNMIGDAERRCWLPPPPKIKEAAN